jgi:transmembrane sensor
MDTKPNKITLNQAAQWYARLHASDCTEVDRIAFKKWLVGSPEREQAYKSVVDAASLISSQLGSDPRMRAMVAEAMHESDAARSTTRFSGLLNLGSRFAYAAAIFVLIGIASVFTLGENSLFDTSPSAHFVNNELRKQRLDLSDGSVVYLDAGAELSVQMKKHERLLVLESGRALFEVAHDKSRPFSVSKGGTRVVALGTRFQVDVVPENQTVNVTLAEGSVAVSNSAEVEPWREVLVPGQQLLIDNALHRRQILNVRTDMVTSWSTGFLVFDGTPLRKVLNEINRYAKVKVVLGDSSLAEIPIAGNFIAGGDSSDFVETLTAVFPLRSTRTGANEIVLFEKYDAQNP